MDRIHGISFGDFDEMWSSDDCSEMWSSDDRSEMWSSDEEEILLYKDLYSSRKALCPGDILPCPFSLFSPCGIMVCILCLLFITRNTRVILFDYYPVYFLAQSIYFPTIQRKRNEKDQTLTSINFPLKRLDRKLLTLSPTEY